MDLHRSRVSDTVTRYRVTCLLPASSRLLLVRPEDGAIMATWRETAGGCLHAEWVSSHRDLHAIVERTVVRVCTVDRDDPSPPPDDDDVGGARRPPRCADASIDGAGAARAGSAVAPGPDDGAADPDLTPSDA
jgi:hypothetical protein